MSRGLKQPHGRHLKVCSDRARGVSADRHAARSSRRTAGTEILNSMGGLVVRWVHAVNLL